MSWNTLDDILKYIKKWVDSQPDKIRKGQIQKGEPIIPKEKHQEKDKDKEKYIASIEK